jgi:hypothetical protein
MASQWVVMFPLHHVTLEGINAPEPTHVPLTITQCPPPLMRPDERHWSGLNMASAEILHSMEMV